METFNEGEQDMITLPEGIREAVKLLVGTMTGDSAEIPGSDGNLILMKLGTEEQHNMKVKHAIMVPAPGYPDFCICTKVRN